MRTNFGEKVLLVDDSKDIAGFGGRWRSRGADGKRPLGVRGGFFYSLDMGQF